MSKLNGVETEEKLVGFDARVSNVPAWLQERREQYLLRPEVKHPMSADEMVWPSAVGWPWSSGDQDDIGTKEPDWIGRNAPLWDDLQRLKKYLHEAAECQAHHLVAISLLYGICSKEERRLWDDRLEPTVPPAVAEEWNLLGYDVCDEWLLSGLMNCGYMPGQEDVQALRDRWGPYLNEYGLFGDLQQAAEFKLVSDRRVEEHAPFFVFGIYLLC